ncbi:MAG: DUF4293 domain-containing protein [Bacteroidota bacterium]
MIQRIQSIFLLLAVLANIAVMLLPQWKTELAGEVGSINALLFDAENDQADLQFFEHQESGSMALHTGVFAFVTLSSILLLYTIFAFNNRPRQIRLSYIGIILIFIEVLLLVLLAQSGTNANPQIGFALPIVAILLTWLAARYIRKDDDLVKSVDRIR